MGISYKPLLKLLIDRNIKKMELMKKAGLAPSTMAKFSKNEYVSMEIIYRVCKALDCNPNDVYEFVEDKKGE
jgi:DNA-binding Xre family transcriptional regulator